MVRHRARCNQLAISVIVDTLKLAAIALGLGLASAYVSVTAGMPHLQALAIALAIWIIFALRYLWRHGRNPKPRFTLTDYAGARRQYMNETFLRYRDMTPEQREELHEWFREHDIDPSAVPTDPNIEFTTDRFVIEVFKLTPEGLKYFERAGSQAPVTEKIARPLLRPIPWPLKPELITFKHHDRFPTMDHIPEVTT